MNNYKTPIILIFQALLLLSCGSSKSSRTLLGRTYAEQTLKSALADKIIDTSIQNKPSIISDSLSAIRAAEPILFKTYGEEPILNQRPYEIYFIDSYWVIRGTLPKEEDGGTFLIILDSRDGSVLKLTHGK